MKMTIEVLNLLSKQRSFSDGVFAFAFQAGDLESLCIALSIK